MKIGKHKIDIKILIVVLVATIFCIETIGFALFGKILTLNGVATFMPDGIIEITNITLDHASNAQEVSSPSYSGINSAFDIKFNVTELDQLYEIGYLVTVRNNSSFDYVLSSDNINAEILVNDDSELSVELLGISYGDIIESKSTKQFIVVMTLLPNTEDTEYEINVDYEPEYDTENTGNLIGALRSGSTGNLRGDNKIAHFTYDVINSYDVNKTFSLSINSSIFQLVNQNGQALSSQTINANETNTFDFYVKIKDGAILPRDTEKLTVKLVSSGLPDSQVGVLTLLVDINSIKDTTPPQISNVTAVQNKTENSVTVTWTGTDDASISKYTIIAYNSSNAQVGTYNTTADEEYINLTLNEGTYYFKVYGTDSSGNTATTQQINNATTSKGVCSKSSNYTFKWNATVTYSLTNLTEGSVTTAKVGDSVIITFTAGNNYTCPQTITLQMNGKRLTSGTDYTYARSNSNKTGTITINNVTGDITVTATGTRSTCLLEGTLIKMSDGSYKRIEDINYYDLLNSWSFDTGETTEVYPIWIEKVGNTDSYQLITFSDGTTLKTVGYHGIFNYDLMRFVSVDNPKEFHIGTTVAKVDENNNLQKVKVTNIETINEPSKYYHIVTSRYFNIISNGIITTDGTVALSNLYGFDNNIKWTNKNIKEDELYKYSDFKGLVPHYLYYALRLNEASYLKDLGLDFDTFMEYFMNNQLNKDMIKPLPSILNKYIFRVTASTGISEFVLDGNTYQLPKGKWLNTTDHKIYNGNEPIKIYYSSHFIKIDN